MRAWISLEYPSAWRLVAMALIVTATTAGCTSTPSNDVATVAAARSRTVSEAPEEVAQAEEAHDDRERRERARRRRPPELEMQDEFGFTITEEVRISGEVRANYQRALQLLDEKRYEQGIDLLREVTENAPDVTAPHINLGIAYGLSGDLEQAEASLETAVELSPDHPIVHNELGILYRKTGRFSEARQSYEQALAIHPGFHFARRNLAVLCDLYLADLGCALENYEIYSHAVPEDEEVGIWIADIRNRLGQ